MQHRGPAGAVAENVAMGCETEACARRMWMQSPRHRANMMLGGCQAVASAVSASGRRYWAMLIGGSSRAGIRRAGVTRVRVPAGAAVTMVLWVGTCPSIPTVERRRKFSSASDETIQRKRPLYGACSEVNSHRVCNLYGHCWTVCD
jgi:hypothetical protein